MTGTTRLGGALTVDGASTLTGDVSVATAALSFGETTRQMINLWRQGYGIGVQNSTQYFRSDAHFAWFTGGSHVTAEVSPGTGGATVMALRGGKLGVGTDSPAQKLMVVGPHNDGKDADSGLTSGGQVAIKGNAPQIDFIDTDKTNGNDWAIHVNSNKMYFIRQPWIFTDLVLDGAGNVGVGTDGPTSKLHVAGNALVTGTLTANGAATLGDSLSFGAKTRQMINLYNTDYGLGVQSNTTYFRAGNSFAWFRGGTHSDLEANAGGGGTTLMVLRNGNLALGSDTPENRDGWSRVLDVLGNPHTKLSIRTANVDARVMAHDTGFWGSQPGMILGTQSAHQLTLGTRGQPRLIITDDGLVGVGKQPTSKFDVNGDISISSASRLYFVNGSGSQSWQIYPEWTDPNDPDLFFNWSANSTGWASGWLEPAGAGWRNNSDRRLKEEIEDLGPVLDRVLGLRPTTFRMQGSSPDKAKLVGFIAQEVQEQFPTLVSDKYEYLSLNYTDFGVLAIAAIRELAARVVALQGEVNRLLPEGAEPVAVLSLPPEPAERAAGPATAAAARTSAPANKAGAARKAAPARKAAATKGAVTKAAAKKASGRRGPTRSGEGA